MLGVIMNERIMGSASDQTAEREASGLRIESELKQLQAQYNQALDQILTIPDGKMVEGALADKVREIKENAFSKLTAHHTWIRSSCERRIWRLLYDILGAEKVDAYARRNNLSVKV